MNAQEHLCRGLALALGDIADGRDDLREALSMFEADGERTGALVAAAALVQFIGIADDDYNGFQFAVDTVAATQLDFESIIDANHRLLARTGSLVAAWFEALDDPRLGPQAEALVRELGNEAVAPAVRCCAGLAVLAYFDAHFDLERTLWLELADAASARRPRRRYAAGRGMATRAGAGALPMCRARACRGGTRAA